MPRERLTQERVEAARPGEFLCDEKVTGLMLIVGKRLTTWVAQREVKDAETGVRKTARVSLGHFPDLSLQEARAAARDQLRKMELGTNPHAARQTNLTVRRAVEQYIEGAVDLRPRTAEGYKYCLEKYLTSIHNVPLSDLGKRPALVRQLFLDLSKKGKGIANGSARLISAVYNGARELNPDLPPNPIRRGVIRMHRLPKRTTRIPEDGFPAWGVALMSIENPIRRSMRLFLLLTGQRDTATQTMRWSDVDFQREKIHYPDPKGGPAAAFDLPMSSQVRLVLEFVRKYSVEAWAFPGSEFVWPSHSKKTGHICETKEQRRAVLLNPHALRRTFISTGYEVAANKFISFIANHACKDSITDQYFNPSIEAVRRALEVTDKAILDKIGIPLENLLAGKPPEPGSVLNKS